MFFDVSWLGWFGKYWGKTPLAGLLTLLNQYWSILLVTLHTHTHIYIHIHQIFVGIPYKRVDLLSFRLKRFLNETIPLEIIKAQIMALADIMYPSLLQKK